MTSSAPTILIASYLEPEHVERIRSVDERITVLYEPDLLRPPRYPADHHGGELERTAEQERQWRSLLKQADILFDFDHTHRDDLPELAPNLKWLQATSAGIGQFVKRMDYTNRIPGVTFTTASGVHSQPLAEFCLMSMLMFSRRFFKMAEQQERHHWERLAGTDLRGRTAAIVGLGKIGQHVAALAKAFGMTVIGSKRTISNEDAQRNDVDALFGPDGLHQMLSRAEFLVLATPHTPETEALIGRDELALLPEGAVLINIGRGAIVDEDALLNALNSGHLAGAALDVFAEEPLPHDSPFWDMPNVLVSPHSASTSDRENGRITDIFVENLQRYLRGEPLINVLDVDRLY